MAAIPLSILVTIRKLADSPEAVRARQQVEEDILNAIAYWDAHARCGRPGGRGRPARAGDTGIRCVRAVLAN